MRGWVSWVSAITVAAFGLQHALNRYNADVEEPGIVSALFSLHLAVAVYGLLVLTILLCSRHRAESTRPALWTAFFSCIIVATLAPAIAAKIKFDDFPFFTATAGSFAIHMVWGGIFLFIVHARTARRRALEGRDPEDLLGHAGMALGGPVAGAVMFAMLFFPGPGIIRRMLALPAAFGLHLVGSMVIFFGKSQLEKYAAQYAESRTAASPMPDQRSA